MKDDVTKKIEELNTLMDIFIERREKHKNFTIENINQNVLLLGNAIISQIEELQRADLIDKDKSLSLLKYFVIELKRQWET